MKIRLTFALFILLINATSFGQQFSSCEILHISYDDSCSTKVLETIKYNPKGQVISNIYTGTGSDFYFYKDTLLIKILQIDEEGDSSIVLHSYNTKGQRIKSLYYDYENDKGSDEDVKRAKRTLSAEINYSYDEQGNKIVEDATKKYWSRDNKQIWQYDNHNRIIEERRYSAQKSYPEELYWTKRYEYFDSSYKCTRTLYDTDGTPQHLKENRFNFFDQHISTFKLNNKKQVVEEIIVNQNGDFVSKQLTVYNEFEHISKVEYFYEENKLGWTDFYTYKK